MTQYSKWITCDKSSSSAKDILICFPYAGGGPSIFKHWQPYFGNTVCVYSVNLPGREARSTDDFPENIESAAAAIAENISKLNHHRLHFFGHSFGALLSYVVAQHLIATGQRPPETLFVSGKAAPHIAEGNKVHLLSDVDLKQRLAEYGGLPEKILENHDLMDIFLPRIRSDIGLGERYSHTDRKVLPSNIVAYCGLKDKLTDFEGVNQWRQHTRGSFKMKCFDDGHFFIHSKEKYILKDLKRSMLIKESSSICNKSS